VVDHFVVAPINEGPPRQQLIRPGQQFLVFALAGEGVGRGLACLGAFTVTDVELQAGQQRREPSAGDQQLSVLGEGYPAVEEPGDIAQALLSTRGISTLGATVGYWRQSRSTL
jgi:hypothetical protein